LKSKYMKSKYMDKNNIIKRCQNGYNPFIYFLLVILLFIF